MAGRRLTLADVALAAGVSKMTASRALRDTSDVSKESVEKVRRAAREIGYVGNHVAMSLSSRTTNLIGAVVPSASNIVFAEVLSGISETLFGSGFQPVIGVTDYDPEREYETVRSMLSWQPAGLIVTGLDQSADTRRLLEAAEVPIVQIMDMDGDPVDGCVGIAQAEAGAAMGRALLGAGRRRFGYVACSWGRDTRAAKRRHGFEAALAAAGVHLVGSITTPRPSSVEMGRTLTRQFLERHGDVDCIYYSNDDIAVGGLFHCMDCGVSVPDDILLSGFNGLDLVKALPGRMATTSTPRREIGLKAAELVMQAARRRERVGLALELPTTIDLVAEPGAAVKRQA